MFYRMSTEIHLAIPSNIFEVCSAVAGQGMEGGAAFFLQNFVILPFVYNYQTIVKKYSDRRSKHCRLNKTSLRSSGNTYKTWGRSIMTSIEFSYALHQCWEDIHVFQMPEWFCEPI